MFAHGSIAYGAVEVPVQSITWNGSWYVVVLENPGVDISGSGSDGILPMRDLYSGNDVHDLYPNNTFTSLKCSGSLGGEPYFSTATSTGTINIDKGFHNGSYHGPFYSDSGIVTCDAPGIYYNQWSWSTGSKSGVTYYFQYYWTGTEIELINADWYLLHTTNNQSEGVNTRFTNGVVSSSTGLIATINYFLDDSEWTGQQDRPDMIWVNVSDVNASQVLEKQKLILPLVNGATSTVINLATTTLADGNYTAQVMFRNLSQTSQGGGFVFQSSSITINFTMSGGSVTSSSLVSLEDGRFPSGPVTYENCGITNLSGCFNNSIKYLFIPSSSAINGVVDLKETLGEKFPFAYVFQFGTVIEDLYQASSTASSSISYDFAGLGQLELISVSQLQAVPFTSWLRTLLGMIMWIMFTILVYDKTKKIFNRDTV